MAYEYLKYPFSALQCTLILSSCLNGSFVTCQESKAFLCAADSYIELPPPELQAAFRIESKTGDSKLCLLVHMENAAAAASRG